MAPPRDRLGDGSSDALGDAVAGRLAGLAPVERGVPVGGYTTYGLGGPAAALVRLGSLAAVAALADVVGELAPEVLVVGKGSNLLVADRGFDGIAVVLEGELAAVHLDAAQGRVRAGGGAGLQALAREAAAAGLAGVEFYVGIPGTVGGAVAMNAGGHGRDTRAVLLAAEVCPLAAGGHLSVRTADDLDLGYRHSNLGPTDLVVGAELMVTPAPVEECRARVAEIVQWRREHQPGGSNAGSVFRNPPDDSAGRLIDEIGLKGLRVGGAMVSPEHANFFQADAGATAADVRALVLEVRERVRAATGVELVPELRMVGFEVPG